MGAHGGPGACDWCLDCDGDGSEGVDDCDDRNPVAYPGAEELCDGVDNDCDGAIPAGEVDGDDDGWRICAGDCDDADPAVHPGALESCDGVDRNCDGEDG